MPKIAISYRRADTAQIAGRIRDRLVSKYGADSTFMDIHDVPLGVTFPDHVRKIWSEADLLVALIGPAWMRNHQLPWPAVALRYLVLPIFVVLVAHYVLVNGFDLDIIYLRIASALLPIPFGIAFHLETRARPTIEFGIGVILGAFATSAMTMSASVRYHQPILPSGAFEWFDNAEYVVTIALGFWAGTLLGRVPVVTLLSREEDDWVRVEVETALDKKLPIIPVLVDGAVMPTAQQLPKSMQAMAYYNATELRSGADFEFHMNRLIAGIDQTLVNRAFREKQHDHRD